MDQTRTGLWQGVAAYAFWGFVPLYWKLLADVPVRQVLGHRVLWSALLLLGWMAATGRLSQLAEAVRRPGVVRTYALAAGLIAVNWTTFIWAVGAGHVVDASLGYFINPLLSVLLGVFVLGERLRVAQWVAVGIAAAGVLSIAGLRGELPWISLLLASTFAAYSLVKKRAPLGSVPGLALETGLLVLPALLLLVAAEAGGGGRFLRGGAGIDALLLGAGVVTAIPLLLFASSARRIPLSWVGLLQYIAPTLQLVLGVAVFGEAFGRDRALGFALVWVALALFAVDGLRARRAAPAPAPVPPPE